MIKIDDLKVAANGRWLDIFGACGIDVKHNKKHGPCPMCGGKDRFRVDDKGGDGTWICNVCGAGDGLKLVTLWMNNDIKRAIEYCGEYCGLESKSDFDIEQARRQAESRRKKQMIEDAKAKAESQSLAVETASGLMPYCSPANCDHDYLSKKQIGAHTALYCDSNVMVPVKDKDSAGFNARGCLVVPMVNDYLNLVNCQLITPSGFKMFLTGGQIIGAFHIIGKMNDGQNIAVVEGFATGATVRVDTGFCVVVAFNANNLKPVAESVRFLCPTSSIVIFGDNDWHLYDGNIGKKKAVNAAMAVNGKAVFPQWMRGVTDFNDAANIYGEHINLEYLKKIGAIK